MHAYLLTFLPTHMCVCVCIHIHICTYTHIRISHAYPRLTTLDLNVLWAYPCGLQNCVLKFETFQGHGSQDLAGFCGVHIGKNSTYWRSNKRCIDCHHSTRTGIARRLSKHNQRQNEDECPPASIQLYRLRHLRFQQPMRLTPMSCQYTAMSRTWSPTPHVLSMLYAAGSASLDSRVACSKCFWRLLEGV